jgi:Terminase RNaseH-like domain
MTRKSPDSITKLLREYVNRNTTVQSDDAFPRQDAFVQDSSRFITAQCSRRAGKTNGLARRFKSTMDLFPGSTCRYLSLTRESAKNIMWPVLHELNDKYNWGCSFRDSNLTMIDPKTRSRLQLYGADMSNFIKRLKGTKSPGVGIDEAQDFGPHLRSLIDDVITPTIVDYPSSWLALTGTPGPAPQGYFFEATQERKYGYSGHSWTILDNPHIPSAGAFINDLIKRNGWEPNHPTLLREWRNQWVLDVQSLWVRYDQKRNHYEQRPKFAWQYVLGIDLGFKDADAIAVLCWSPDSPEIYLVEERIAHKQGISELVTQIEALQKEYEISKMVIDEGGLGKKIAEELRRQKQIPVTQADKMRKQENVEWLNDALRTGKFKAKATSRFAQDSYLVQIDWEKSRADKIVVKKHPHSDIIDAVLYAFKECYAFAYKPPIQDPKLGSKEYWEKITTDMFEQALERAQTQEHSSQIDKDITDYRKWKY